MIDAYVWGKVERISPEAPVPVVSVEKKECRLGGAANVALNILSLGAQPILCGIVGNDEMSTTFFQLLQHSNLSAEGIYVVNNRPTTTKTRIIGGKQQLLRLDEEVSSPLEFGFEQTYINHLCEILNNNHFDAIVFQDYDKGSITLAVIDTVVNFANQRKIPILVDPKRRNFGCYNHTAVFKPNFKEFCEGIKRELSKNDFQEIFQYSVNFLNEHDIQYLLLTLSEHGVLLIDKDKYYHIPAHVRDIADVSGAGDTVISLASLCMAISMEPYQMAAIANLAGGLVCEKVGVVPITRQMLEKELANFVDFNLKMKE
jgi:rfaE bifunctional protein kinase chain/domain